MSDQPSSSAPSQPGSPTGSSTAQPAASPPSSSQPSAQPNSGAPAAPQRPDYVLDSQWDGTTNSVKHAELGTEVKDLRAFKAEQDVRKHSLPKTEAGYEARLPAGFQAPEGVTFQFDANSPELAQARKIALARGMDQETFSEFLGVYAANKIGEQQNQAKLRQTNLDQLGAAGPQRVDAVATWLQARAGEDGKHVADFIKKYPSSSLVKTFENLIRQFSNQGGADYSQQHRETVEQQAGKIPGYENMTFTQRRAAQMAQKLNAGGAGR